MRLIRCLLLVLVTLPALVWGQTTVINGNRVHAGWVNYGTTAGTTTAYTLSFSPPLPGYTPGQCFLFKPHVTNTGPATLNVQGKGALPLTKDSGGSLVPLAAGDLLLNRLRMACHDGAALQLIGTAAEPDGDKGDLTVSASGTVWTIDPSAVTYAKIQNVSASPRVLGRITAGAGPLEELTAAMVKAMLGVAFGDLTGTASDAQIPLLNTLDTGLTPLRCVETDGTGKLGVAAGACGAVPGGTGISGATNHGLLVATGGTTATSLGVATHGQLPIGATGADPTLATLTGTPNQISVTNAPGSITLAIPTNPTLPGTTTANQLAQTAPTNAATVQTLKRATDTPPFTGAFVDSQTAAGTSLWKVDLTGTLTAGTVPAARVSGLSAGTYLNVTDPPYNANGTDLVDDTVAIQAALNSGVATIFIPTGDYYITQLVVPQGVSIIGAGMASQPNAGTRLWQNDGVNMSAIVGAICLAGGTNFWHWSKIVDLTIRKNWVADTIGSGIEVTCRGGEGLRFEHLQIQGFPDSGIAYRRGAQPIVMTDIHLFGNNKYGVFLGRTGPDIWNMVSLQGISGDQNNIALIGISTAGAATDSFHLSDIKAESISSQPQPTVVEFIGLNSAPVYVENLSATGAGIVIPEVFKVTTSTVTLSMHNVRCSNCTNLLTDVAGAITIPWPTQTFYSAEYTQNRFSLHNSNGRTMSALAIGRSQSLTNTMGIYTQLGGVNNITLQTLTRFTDTAPAGNFVTYQSATGASLWNVDITGTLTGGTVPGARVSGDISGQAASLTDGDKGDFTCTGGTCALDAAAPGGDISTATSLATSAYVGDATLGQCTWTEGGMVIEAACDADKTTVLTSDILMFDSGPMQLRNADGDSCATINNITGLTTYHTTGACQRPSVSRPFDALAFNVGTGVTVESVSLNGWPATPVLDGPNSDAGTFALVVPVLWRDFAQDGQVTLQLACHSITMQTGLTLIVRVGAAVCTGANTALPGFVAPTSGQQLTCTFGARNHDVQMSNVVTIPTTGCQAGHRMDIPFASEGDMTAGWSTTLSVITGGILTYETVGSP